MLAWRNKNLADRFYLGLLRGNGFTPRGLSGPVRLHAQRLSRFRDRTQRHLDYLGKPKKVVDELGEVLNDERNWVHRNLLFYQSPLAFVLLFLAGNLG